MATNANNFERFRFVFIEGRIAVIVLQVKTKL